MQILCIIIMPSGARRCIIIVSNHVIFRARAPRMLTRHACFVRITMRTFSSLCIFSFRKICVTTPWQPVRMHVLRPYSMLMKHVYVLFLGFIESTWPTQSFLVCPVFVGFSRHELSKEFGERLFTPLLRHTEKTLHFL